MRLPGMARGAATLKDLCVDKGWYLPNRPRADWT